ncbi:MAG: hypothetical protein AAF413_03755 [Patescibacteria group bacterium]
MRVFQSGRILVWLGVAIFVAGFVLSIYLYLSGGQEVETEPEFTPVALEMTFSNLPPIEKGQYILWRRDNGVYQKFDEQIDPAEESLGIVIDSELTLETLFEVSVEASSAPLSPTGPIVLEGNWSGGSAELRFPVNINGAQGSFILATPTNGEGSLESSGVWFYDEPNESSSLKLEQLPDGWTYEGWVEHREEMLSIGRFESPNWPDDSNQYSGDEPAYPFPGEDFIAGRPGLLAPPLSLRSSGGSTVRISIEPDIDGVDPTGREPWGIFFMEGTVSGLTNVGVPVPIEFTADYMTPIARIIE